MKPGRWGTTRQRGLCTTADSGELRVCRLPTGDCDQPVWRAGLPAGVEMAVLGGDFPIVLTNRGQLSGPLTVQLSKGGMTDVHILQ